MKRRLLESMRALPGITDAALGRRRPDRPAFLATHFLGDLVAEREVRTPATYMSRVTPRFFRTMGTRLEEGRDFTDVDDEKRCRRRASA